MRICNLTSGSDGNMTYIETSKTKVLVDLGITCSEAERRLALLGVKGSEIDAILISHEHSDHIKGIDVFARKYGTKIYAHEESWSVLERKLCKVNSEQFICFGDMEFNIQDLFIETISLPHDAQHCTGFKFTDNIKKFSIITDLGHTNSRILDFMRDSRLIYLESNHDEQMLLNNQEYPAILKRRILGKKGHLSNVTCGQALCEIDDGTPRQIMLSHLSRHNNTPELAYKTVCEELLKKGIVEGEYIKIGVTSIYPSAIFNLN